MSKEAVSANTERVFRERETKANRMLTLILPCFAWNIMDLLKNKLVISTWIGGHIHD